MSIAALGAWREEWFLWGALILAWLVVWPLVVAFLREWVDYMRRVDRACLQEWIDHAREEAHRRRTDQKDKPKN